MCYSRSLFNIYNTKNLLLVHIMDHTKLKVFRKSIISFNIFISGKRKVDNFCNVFYISELEYNLFSFSTI